MTSSTAEGIDIFGGTVYTQVSPNTVNSSTAQSMDDKDFMGFANSTNSHFSGSQPADTNTLPVHSETAMDDFVILSKNVLGMSNDDRLVEMQEELDLIQNWDVVFLSETWRKPTNEYFTTHHGHIFMNCGCEAGRRGVGFFVHRKWAPFIQQFVAISERVSYIKIRHKNKRLVMVSVYFPHTGYPDAMVQEVYDTVEAILDEARSRKEDVIVAGDFNAEVGERNEFDNPHFVGKHSCGVTNSRGAWLKRFCELKSLVIANTMYPKSKDAVTTFVGPNQRARQIDFVLITRRLKALLRDSGSTNDFHMNSDHKTVKVTLRFDTKNKSMNTHKTKQRVEWNKVCRETFQTKSEEFITQQEVPTASNRICQMVEQALLRATKESAIVRPLQETGERNDELGTEIRNLIIARRERQHGNPERKHISKKLQKAIRLRKRNKRREQIRLRLEQFKDIRRIPSMKTQERSRYIVQMVDKMGNTQTNRMSIANVFSAFYEDLYSSQQGELDQVGEFDGDDVANDSVISDFTDMELVQTLRRLKDGRCKDTTGIKAEMLKNTGRETRRILLELYNSVLRGNMETPKSWKKSVITVLYKSGDPSLPKNYRPICIIPLLYKVFSKLLYSRLYPILDPAQCPDQAGFRRNYSTMDHLFVFKMLQEKSEEFQLNTWVAALDFKKAFDSIDQCFLWRSLKDQKVPGRYIEVLRSLCDGQHAQVKTDKLSRSFEIKRGTKQGDPLSSLLFNAILEKVMARAKIVFENKR